MGARMVPFSLKFNNLSRTRLGQKNDGESLLDARAQPRRYRALAGFLHNGAVTQFGGRAGQSDAEVPTTMASTLAAALLLL